jgi:hypothetical protein
LLRCLKNQEGYALQIPNHVIIGETQSTIASRHEPLVTLRIFTNALLEIMALAIDFDHELAGMRDKIGDVVTHLPAEAEAGQAMRF